MKILLVEDNEENIEAAMNQFPDDEITIVKDLAGFNKMVRTVGVDYIYKGNGKVYVTKMGIMEFDLVLTDVFIPMGNVTGSIAKKFSAEELFPLGLTVALSALSNGIPTLILTDSNSHVSVIGAALDCVLKGSNYLYVNTRPEFPKNWKRALKVFTETKERDNRIKEGIKRLKSAEESGEKLEYSEDYEMYKKR